MKSAHWITEAKAKLGGATNREIARRIGISEPSVSQHLSGIAKTLKDEHCLAIAEILGIDPAIILMDQAAERHRETPALRQQFERLGKLASQAAAAGLATVWLAPSLINRLDSISYSVSNALHCILCKMADSWKSARVSNAA